MSDVPIRLSPNVPALGFVSLLMGMSSAMIHSLLPVYLVAVLGASTLVVGLIEGVAEGTISMMKVVSGRLSDILGRRKPLVLLGYGLSAAAKLLFPVATAPLAVLIARVTDRIGKGLRDSPRDALLADVTPPEIRGTGFGLRNALYPIGAVVGPLAATTLMASAADNFRVVLWIALIPAFASVAVLVVWVREPSSQRADNAPTDVFQWHELARLRPAYWWAVAIASLLSLARFSQAFLLLKANALHVDAAFVPLVLVIMNFVYAVAAYPFGRLADTGEGRLQMGFGIAILIVADIVLAVAESLPIAMAGAALWGLQMGILQGLLSAIVADSATPRMRGTAFGVYEFAAGVGTFLASAGAGALWGIGGPTLVFTAGAILAAAAGGLLMLGPSLRNRGWTSPTG